MEWVTDTVQELVSIPMSDSHPRAYRHLTTGALRLDVQGRYIAVERVLIELVEDIRSEAVSLGESKVLPYLDSLKETLEEAERQRLSRIAGFQAPSGTKYIQWNQK